MNSKFTSPLWLRISVWLTSGLVGGTTYGFLSFHAPLQSAASGFIGAVAGIVAALLFSAPIPVIPQTIISCIFTGLSIGLLNLWILPFDQTINNALFGPVISVTIGFLVFRFLYKDNSSELYFCYHKKNATQQGAAANP